MERNLNRNSSHFTAVFLFTNFTFNKFFDIYVFKLHTHRGTVTLVLLWHLIVNHKNYVSGAGVMHACLFRPLKLLIFQTFMTKKILRFRVKNYL